jgi:four helix bundle protein
MFPFQSLALYKKAQQFYLESKKILGHIKVERYINDQLGRASYSIILNIAEGSAKTSNADRKNYFTTSRGSLFECVAILDLLKIENLINEQQYIAQIQLADEISRILYTTIKNLETK